MAELPQSSEPPNKRKRGTGRSKYGCLTCRFKRVKCDESLPSCGRCIRLKLVCEQPCSRILPSLQERRRGFGPWKCRESEIKSLKPILPNSIQPPTPEVSCTETAEVEIEGGENEDGVLYDLDMPWVGYPSPDAETSTGGIFAACPLALPNVDWSLPPLPDFDIFLGQTLGPQITSYHQPIEAVILENGDSLTHGERRALAYFRAQFSLSQTTRDPEWSVTSLLVEHGVYHSEMLLRLILAVSLQDLQSSGEVSPGSHTAAQVNYEIGAQKLVLALQNEESPDHVAVLGGLYCVYAYMSRQNPLVLSRIDRLSYTVLEHVQKHGLDVAFSNLDLNNLGGQVFAPSMTKKDQSLIARLIMWLFKTDAQCGFLGCRSSLLEYFQSRSVELEAIQAASRLALQLSWGKLYPISQSIRDIESSMSVDMMTDLMLLSYRINQYSQTSSDVGSESVELEKELARLEIKYGPVLYYGSSEMTLQPAMKLNCAVAATMFYATKIFFLHKSPPSMYGAGNSPEVSSALSRLLEFARHVCIEGTLQPVYEFQWSLFLACVETNDMIHQEWLKSKICDVRLQRALPLCLAARRDSKGKLDLYTIRTILRGRL